MRVHECGLAALSLAGIAFSGCAGPTSRTNFTQLIPAQAQRNHSASTMRNSSGQSLLYVSSPDQGKVYTYTYPGGKPQVTLSGMTAPSGECVDAAGDVFIVALASPTATSSEIFEYAHGGTSPIATLSDPGHASGCSISAGSGNLAVANIYDSSNPYNSENGSVAIFQTAGGTPTLYYPSEFGILSCGYDNKDNLYLAVSSSQAHVAQLARIAKSDSTIALLSLNATIEDYNDFQPSVQWDGKHLTVTSNSGFGTPVAVYQLRISGSNAKVVGTTLLHSHKDHHGGQSWIARNRIVGIAYLKGSGGVALWRYPEGGQPIQQIKHIVERSQGLLSGVVISPGSQR